MMCAIHKLCIIHSSSGTDIYVAHVHMWRYHPLQLALLVLFHPATSTETAFKLRLLALCGGG